MKKRALIVIILFSMLSSAVATQSYASSDPMLKEQWYLEKIRLFEALEISQPNFEVVVAVIDTGMDVNHEDLKNNIWVNLNEIAGNNIDDDNNGFIDDIQGWDFQDNDNYPIDEDNTNTGHGTIAGGVIAGVAHNGLGIFGMSQKVKLMPIRAFKRDGTSSMPLLAAAIDYALSNGAQVINASWGGQISPAQGQSCIDAIERAHKKGVIFVNAAGNFGKSNDNRFYFPGNAKLDNMIVVAASTQEDSIWPNSNYGKNTVDIAAPGRDIFTTLMGNRYGRVSGTSIAAPIVSGLVALMKSQNPKLDASQIKAILKSTGTPVAIESACNCRIDAYAAMKAVQVLVLSK